MTLAPDFIRLFFFPFLLPPPQVGVWEPGRYSPMLDTDESRFMGQGRVDMNGKHLTFPEEFAGRRNHMCVYSPCRTAQIYAKVGDV